MQAALKATSFQQGLAAAPSIDPQGGKLVIEQLNPNQHAAWDRFVLDHPAGSPFHLTAWKKSIEQTFAYQDQYLIAAEGGRVRGVLPLFLVKNFLIGKVLISSPFAVYGGILADSEEVRNRMCAHVRELGERLGVQHVELRNAWEEQCAGLTRISRYVTFTQSLSENEASILEAIPRKTRYMVRKSLKEGLESRRQSSDPSAFENLYSRNLRKLGTPSFPERHFKTLLENFQGMADVREVLLGDEVVAAVLCFYFRDQILPYYGASEPRYNAIAPNNFMYFDLMRWGGQNGYRTFDFGRSKKVKGAYDFKSHWGMKTRELPYEVILVKRKKLPNYTPANPAFRLPILCWQRLPLMLTRALGPPLVRLLP